MKTWIGFATLALFCCLPAAQADTPAPGYSVQSSPSPAFAAPIAK